MSAFSYIIGYCLLGLAILAWVFLFYYLVMFNRSWKSYVRGRPNGEMVVWFLTNLSLFWGNLPTETEMLRKRVFLSLAVLLICVGLLWINSELSQKF